MWADTLQQATYRGVPFEVVSVGRSGQRAIAEHEYPYTAGADLEDLNLRARRVRIRAFFWGDDYEEQLAAFIDALEAPGVGELIHPIHGSMMVLPATWSDDHQADEVDSASVEVEFVEDATRAPVFAATSGAAKADAIVAAADELRVEVDGALERYLAAVPSFDLPRITVLKDAFGAAKTALSGLMNATTGVKLLLSDLDPLLYPRAYAADLLSIIDRGLQGLPFGGRNILFGGSSVSVGSGVVDFETARQMLDPVVLVLPRPTGFLDPRVLVDVAVVEAHARIHAAAGVAEAATVVLAGELEETLLERADIEVLSNHTRAALQYAIDTARAVMDPEGRAGASTALRNLAFAVEEAARAVINQRPPLVRKPAPIGGPVRLVAHAIYGDASRAPEVSRLNRLGRHVLIDRGEVLNVYAA